jgi:hypothetical protein
MGLGGPSTEVGPESAPVLLEQAVVDHRVVGPVDEQRLAVDPEPRRLGHIGAQDLDFVPAVDLDGRPVLGADHDGLGGAAPELLEPVPDVVDPRGPGLVVGEPELLRELRGDVDEAVLGQDHGGSDVVDVGVGQRDQQHRRVVVAVPFVVRGVELRVTGDAEARSLDLVDRLAVLVVRGHRGLEAVEGLVELVGGGAEHSAAGQGNGDEQCQGCQNGTATTGHRIPPQTSNFSTCAPNEHWFEIILLLI